MLALLVDSEKIRKLVFSGSVCLGKPWLTGDGWLAGSGDFARAFKKVCNGVVRWLAGQLKLLIKSAARAAPG